MPSTLTATAGARDAVRASSSQSDGGRWSATVSFAAVLLVLVVAPFESTTPLLRLPGQSISTVESVLLLAFGAWGLTMIRTWSSPSWMTPLTLPGLALLLALAVAAAFAPADRSNALHMVGRLGLASGLFVATVTGITTWARARTLMWVACGTGVVAGLLVLIDFTGLPVGQMLLGPFRTQTALVGAQVRASGSFQYPTIASMFLEITYACGIGLVPLTAGRTREHGAMALRLLVVALLITAAAIVLTYTRSGLITMATSLVIVGALHVYQSGFRSGFDRAVKVLLAVGLASAAMIPLSRSTEAMRLRLTTEGQDGWYRARVDAPPRVTLGAGSRLAVPVTLTNTGGVTWDSSAAQPFGFSYHWLLSDSDRIVSWEGIRSAFPDPVRPGEQVTLVAQLEAPRQPGEYRIVWDLYQENLLWFSTEPDAELSISQGTVTGASIGAALDRESLRPMPKPTRRPGRGVLWGAAFRMLAERPWLGIGADNFRLHYGPYAHLPRADPRVHTNNMYIELVVGGGLVAGLALAWLVACTLRFIVDVARQPAVSDAVTPGAIAAVVAIGLHGLVDSFLGFTATYAAMAIMFGLVVACGRLAHAHAHRI